MWSGRDQAGNRQGSASLCRKLPLTSSKIWSLTCMHGSMQGPTFSGSITGDRFQLVQLMDIYAYFVDTSASSSFSFAFSLSDMCSEILRKSKDWFLLSTLASPVALLRGARGWGGRERKRWKEEGEEREIVERKREREKRTWKRDKRGKEGGE